MLPTKTDIKVSGDLGGEKIEMSLDSNSTAYLMSFLTDLYKDPLLAIIREYSTNALDSHVAAGQTRPIEVTTPNYLSSTFRVKDYGLGMDATDIREVYSSYGASTKRTTNDQVGMLGLGCKSALTFTNQFNIVAVKNGVKTSVAVSRSENGAGVMEIIDESPTSDGNGVEIIIPVQGGNDVLHKAKFFFKFWNPGLVLLNGKEPDYIWDNSTKVGRFHIITDSFDYVVMGNVAYPVDYSFTGNNRYYRERAVVKVDVGSVAFTPSREALQMTGATKKMLAELKDEYAVEIVNRIEAEISSCKDYAEANNKLRSLKNKTSFQDFIGQVTYRGERFIERYNFDWYLYGFKYGSITANDGSLFNMNRDLNSVIVLYGFDCAKINTPQKKKVDKYLRDNSLLVDDIIVVVCNEKPDSKWFSNSHQVAWSTIKAIKMPSSKVVRAPDTWDILKSRTNRLYNQQIDSTKKTLYGSGAEINADSDPILSVLNDGKTEFILVAKNRQEKFKKAYPNAIYWLDEARARVLDYINNLAQGDIQIINQDTTQINIISLLDTSKILDPAITTLALNDVVKNQEGAQNRYTIYSRLAYHLNIDNFPRRPAAVKSDILDRYPLVTHIGYWGLKNVDKDHIYAYMNSVYQLGLK